MNAVQLSAIRAVKKADSCKKTWPRIDLECGEGLSKVVAIYAETIRMSMNEEEGWEMGRRRLLRNLYTVSTLARTLR